jgi:serine/threonine-protein kinase
MEYVPGVSLSTLTKSAMQSGMPLPIPVVISIIVGALHGLHAAHEATNEDGRRLGLIHRDVSPQNVLVGTDGVSRLLDFGIAKAEGRLHTTREGQLKGKLSYMAPEQLRGSGMTHLVDVYAAGIVLWEALTGRRLFAGKTERETIQKVLAAEVVPPSQVLIANAQSGTQQMSLPILQRIDAVVMRALAATPEGRFPTARDFALALEGSAPIASQQQVGDIVSRHAGDVIRDRAERISALERKTLAITTSGVAARPRPRLSSTDVHFDERPPDTVAHGRAPMSAAEAARAFDSDHPTILDPPPTGPTGQPIPRAGGVPNFGFDPPRPPMDRASSPNGWAPPPQQAPQPQRPWGESANTGPNTMPPRSFGEQAPWPPSPPMQPMQESLFTGNPSGYGPAPGGYAQAPGQLAASGGYGAAPNSQGQPPASAAATGGSPLVKWALLAVVLVLLLVIAGLVGFIVWKLRAHG